MWFFSCEMLPYTYFKALAVVFLVTHYVTENMTRMKCVNSTWKLNVYEMPFLLVALWCFGSYDTSPALVSFRKISLATTFRLPFVTLKAHFSFHTPVCSLTHHVHLLATLPVCVLIPFSLWKVPMMHGASQAAVSAATTSATSVPFASASANQVCSIMALLSLSHTHIHFLCLNKGCFWVLGVLWKWSLPLVGLHRFLDKSLHFDLVLQTTNCNRCHCTGLTGMFWYWLSEVKRRTKWKLLSVVWSICYCGNETITYSRLKNIK